MSNINLKNVKKLLSSEKAQRGDSSVLDNLLFLGKGVECKAYSYKDICIKDYGDEHEAIRQLESWKKCGKSKLFPKIYGIKGRYLIMERIYGELMEHVDDDEYLELAREELTKFAKEQVEKGIMPYDLHPCNVMITNDEKIKIIDVGYFSTLEEEELGEEEALYSLNEDYEEWYSNEHCSYSSDYNSLYNSCESSWM